jgi:hypothetical protein
MTTEVFEKIFNETVERSRQVLVNKAREYATDDRLHNFKVAAEVEGVSPIQALGGMMAKHTVSVYDLIRNGTNSEPMCMWDEKITDSINYLILLRALVIEEKERENAQDLADAVMYANNVPVLRGLAPKGDY